jgi:hypothetical protein
MPPPFGVCWYNVCGVYTVCLWCVHCLFVVCTLFVCGVYTVCTWCVNCLYVVCTLFVYGVHHVCAGLARTMHIYGVYTVFWQENHQLYGLIWCVYIQFWPTLRVCSVHTRNLILLRPCKAPSWLVTRVGQNNIYTVYIRYFWLGNHQLYGVYIPIYTVLANPTCNLVSRIWSAPMDTHFFISLLLLAPFTLNPLQMFCLLLLLCLQDVTHCYVSTLSIFLCLCTFYYFAWRMSPTATSLHFLLLCASVLSIILPGGCHSLLRLYTFYYFAWRMLPTTTSLHFLLLCLEDVTHYYASALSIILPGGCHTLLRLYTSTRPLCCPWSAHPNHRAYPNHRDNYYINSVSLHPVQNADELLLSIVCGGNRQPSTRKKEKTNRTKAASFAKAPFSCLLINTFLSVVHGAECHNNKDATSS